MKKLMVTFIAGLFAVVANAASMNWATCGEVLDPAGVAAGGEEYITMYMFVIDAATYGNLTANGEAGVSKAVWTAYGSSLNVADASYVDDGMGQFVITDETAYSVGQTAYAAIIMAYDEGEGITHYKGNVGSFTFEADTDATIENMDTVVFGGDNSTAISWTAVENVPEPTSGLLLLLGVAGLALKRKRA